MSNLISKNKAKTIFISSVFKEFIKESSGYTKVEWSLRDSVYNVLLNLGYNPWMWEYQGKKLEHIGKSPEQIISNAIQNSDLVVVFYKKRAGSCFSNNCSIPFYATDYEIIESVRSGVPFRLFLIGDSHTFRLESVLSLVANEDVFNTSPIKCINENDAISKVLREIEVLFSSDKSATSISTQIPSCVKDIEHLLGEAQCILSKQAALGNYHIAYELSKNYIFLNGFTPISKQQKILKGRYLAICANIYANTALYDLSIRVACRSIYLFMEVGEWSDMFGQIQALSGIKNMAGISSARWLNAYGLRTVGIYKNLASDYLDSRASIYRDMGRHAEALRLLEKNCNWEKTPYSATKYARLLGLTQKSYCLDTARKLVQEEILPWARQGNQDVSYVLREAGFLAMIDNDISSAKIFLDEAEKLSILFGYLHTRKQILKIKRRINY